MNRHPWESLKDPILLTPAAHPPKSTPTSPVVLSTASMQVRARGLRPLGYNAERDRDRDRQCLFCL